MNVYYSSDHDSTSLEQLVNMLFKLVSSVTRDLFRNAVFDLVDQGGA